MVFSLAMVPILIVFVWIFLFKRSSIEAGILACMIASLIGMVSNSFSLVTPDILGAILKSALTTSMVAYILFFGILLFHLMNEAGAIQGIASFVSQTTNNPTRQVLLLAVAFSPLVESAGGFGLAIIVIAPILITLGFNRTKAIVISLLSLTAVPWGALATGTVIGANLSGLPLHELGVGSAILSIPTFLYFSIVMTYISGGFNALRKHLLEVLFVTISLSLAIWFFSRYISVELAGVFGAIIALSTEMFLIRITERKPKLAGAPHATPSIFRTMSPYFLLILLLFITRTLPVLETHLKSIVVWHWPQYDFKLPLLYSPGFCLLLVCLYTLVNYRLSLLMIIQSLKRTIMQIIPVLLSTLGFVAMAHLMDQSGMTHVLSSSAAQFFGFAFLYFSPLIGGLGGFLTGSNTGSNAMFMQLQLKTAHHLPMNPDLIAYAQNTSSSHLTMASPSRVVLATSIGKIPNQENRILRTLFLIGLGTLLLLIIEVGIGQTLLAPT
ncbi:L-lactate permease [Marininema halotolerans]|uniref:L-lactate permease n=1 Tax=Marininema halotolerans TaxID=1155944 RepID=A0A1I6SU23_9BACL|nr:L-lactate permease [Marininema halotolerans]SFS80434.1 lactate permease [Marininema halotolerans]